MFRRVEPKWTRANTWLGVMSQTREGCGFSGFDSRFAQNLYICNVDKMQLVMTAWWGMSCDWKSVFSSKLGDSRKDGDGCSKCWQFYFYCTHCHQTVTVFAEVSFFISNLHVGDFYDFKLNICHGYWKNLTLIPAWRSWYTAAVVKNISLLLHPPIPHNVYVIWPLSARK